MRSANCTRCMLCAAAEPLTPYVTIAGALVQHTPFAHRLVELEQPVPCARVIERLLLGCFSRFAERSRLHYLCGKSKLTAACCFICHDTMLHLVITGHTVRDIVVDMSESVTFHVIVD